MATSIEERRQRVAGGSRRRRDLQAAGIPPSGRGRERWQIEAERRAATQAAELQRRIERETRLRPQVAATTVACDAWACVRADLEAGLPTTTFVHWVEPLQIVGEVNGALWLEAGEDKAAWIERRYSALIGDRIRELTGLRGFYLGRIEEADEGDGLL